MSDTILLNPCFLAASKYGLDEKVLSLIEHTVHLVEGAKFLPGESITDRSNLRVFYSGPSTRVCKKMGVGIVKSNWERSIEMASRMRGLHIEDSLPSRMVAAIFGKDFWFHQKGYLFSFSERSRFLREVVSASRSVMGGYVSRRYASMEFNHAVTAVCGANPERAFLKSELPTMMKNGHVRTINGIDMEAVREMAYRVRLDDAYNLVCLGELREVYVEAKKHIQKDDEAWEDYQERLVIYALERQIAEDAANKSDQSHSAAREMIMLQCGFSQ